MNTLAHKRLGMLFDDGIFSEFERFYTPEDSGEVICAYGFVSGAPAYAFAQNTAVCGGAMGRAQSEKILRLYEKASMTGLPVIALFDSVGAHVSEGMAALAAYGNLIKMANNISGVVPQIALVLGGCIGSAALLATSSDIVIMSKDAEMYVTAGSILGDKLVGSADTAFENGTAHLIADDDASAIAKTRALITFLPANNLSVSPIMDYIQAEAAESLNDTESAVKSLVDAGSAIELSENYGKTAYTALCRIAGNAVGIVATTKHEENGKLSADGCHKIARFVRFCDAFSIPVITFVDTFGFLVTGESELSGGIKPMSALSHAYAEATIPKISVITGNAIGAAYTALAGKASGADMAFAWKTAVVSPLEPLTAACVLYSERIANGESREALAKEYIENDACAFNAAKQGFLDDVIEPEETFSKVMAALEMLSSKRVSTLDKKHSNIVL